MMQRYKNDPRVLGVGLQRMAGSLLEGEKRGRSAKWCAENAQGSSVQFALNRLTSRVFDVTAYTPMNFHVTRYIHVAIQK